MANGTGRRRGRPSNTERAAKAAEAKENAVESGQVLDLQPVEIDERDFNLHLKSIKSALDKKETAMSLLRTCRKRAKEASPEILSAVDFALSFERLDQDELARRLQLMGFALKHTESPIQLTLHNTLLGDATETAYKRGFKDGEAGRTARVDYPDGSDLAKEYTRGWNHGTAKNLGVSPEQADVAIAEDTVEPLYNSEPPHVVDDEPQPVAA